MKPVWGLPLPMAPNRAERRLQARQEKRTLARTLKRLPRTLSASVLDQLPEGATWKDVSDLLSSILPPLDQGVEYGISCCGCGVLHTKTRQEDRPL